MQAETDPDIRWVEALSHRPSTACAAAIREAQAQRRLFSHLAEEHDTEGRVSYVEIDAPLELHALVRLLRPTHVVEVGVSSGVSSAYILNAMEMNGFGTLHSVDLPSLGRPRAGSGKPPRMSWSLPPGRSSGWAVPFPLRKRWDLRLGDKADVLPILAEELPAIGLFLYDVPHRDQITRTELRRLDRLIPPAGVVIVDHGPGGELCAALRTWAKGREARPVGRTGLGLYGARAPNGAG